MIEVLPVASSGVTLSTDYDIEVHFVPKIYNKLASHRVIVRLLEQLDSVSGGAVSKELAVAKDRLKMVENVLMNKVALNITSSFSNYDKSYGVNKKHLIQDFDRNRYIGSTGW
jgi:hypothetical protein